MPLKCTCLEFHPTELTDKLRAHGIQDSPWETEGAEVFILNNKTYMCIVEYHSSFPVMKLTVRLSAGSFIKICKIIFAEYEL